LFGANNAHVVGRQGAYPNDGYRAPVNMRRDSGMVALRRDSGMVALRRDSGMTVRMFCDPSAVEQPNGP
jgi:hypothetical protein